MDAPIPPTAPLTPLGARTPHAHPALYGVVAGLSLIILAGAAWVFWPRTIVAPTPSPVPTRVSSASPSGAVIEKDYTLDCATYFDSFRTKYPWFEHFAGQMLPGWMLFEACFNPATNQVVYVKTAVQDGRTVAQIGVYSIALDMFDKSPVVDADDTGNCWIESWAGDSIRIECGVGDMATVAFRLDLDTRTMSLIQSSYADVATGQTQNPHELNAAPRVVVSVPGASFAQPSAWPSPTEQPGNHPLDGASETRPEYAAAVGPIGNYLGGSTDSPYHIAVYGALSYEKVLAYIRKYENPGNYQLIRTDSLNGMRAISYQVGGLCGGPEVILFGATRTVVFSSYCVSEDKDMFDSIAPTIRVD